MLKKIIVGAAMAGLVVAVVPSVAHAAPGVNSMTSCVITDGTLTSTNFPLTVPADVQPSSSTVTMIPTPASGKFLYEEGGFLNTTTNEFVTLFSGTGAVDNAGYQPPADPGYYVASQVLPNYPDYATSEWTYEYRWWAVRGDVGSLVPDMPGSPLCKISVVVTPSDATSPTISGSDSVTVNAPLTAVETYTADESVDWSVTGGSNQDLFQIDASTGALSFKNPSAVGTYAVVITATDAATNASTLSITVTVQSAALPKTGSDVQTYAPMLIGVSLAFVALGAVLIRRRMRTSAHGSQSR